MNPSVTPPLSIKEQLVNLIQLQELDLKIDHLNKQKNGLPGVLKAIDDQISVLSRQMTTQTASLEEIQKRERQTRAAMDMNRERESRAGGKLSTVGNTNEYQAANREIDQLKKHQTTLDQQLQAISADAGKATESLDSSRSKITELQAQRDSEAAKISGEGEQLAGQASELVGQRAQFTVNVEKRVLMTYDRVRGARAGIGVSPASGGRCGICNILVPPQMYNELQKGREFHSCPNCHRFLYVK